jgi:hypothetical protein
MNEISMDDEIRFSKGVHDMIGLYLSKNLERASELEKL